jgi:hypothetical protein
MADGYWGEHSAMIAIADRTLNLGEFCPGQRVHVGPGIEGVIESTTLALTADGLVFVNWLRVVWWVDGVRHSQEVSPWEARPAANGAMEFK